MSCVKTLNHTASFIQNIMSNNNISDKKFIQMYYGSFSCQVQYLEQLYITPRQLIPIRLENLHKNIYSSYIILHMLH